MEKSPEVERKSVIVRKAFLKSLPVMAGYIVLGIGFGILLRNAGYGTAWSVAMAVLIYAGSMQYVGIGLLAGGAGILTTILTTVMVNARHLFYSISMIDRYKNAGKYKPYMIFALTDETYSLLCDGKTPDPDYADLYRFLVSLFNHLYWITGCLLGSLLGAVAGYYGGPADAILMRLSDTLTAFPAVLPALLKIVPKVENFEGK